jgi:translation initiation factor IF-3
MPRGPRTNRKIRITPIRVIGPQGQQVGIMETADALSLAEEQDLDLVEIQPDSRPPVCKIMDYGKHKYDQSKKANRSRAAARASGGDLKEVRLGRSVKIDPNDVRVRVGQARKFLMKMDKVQLTQRFRGREIVHKDLGLQRLQEIAEELADISKIESAPRWNGRSASIILAPDRARISAQRDREASFALNAKLAEEEAQSNGDPSAEAKAQAPAEAKAQAPAEAKSEAKPKAKAKPEAKAKAKAEAKAEAKPEAKAEAKPEAKAEAKAKPKAKKAEEAPAATEGD